MGAMDHFEPLLIVLRPLLLMSLSIYYLPPTLLTLAKNSPTTLFSWSNIKNAWFARFWTWFGPTSRDNVAPTIQPLVNQASGNVLDVGSGQGHWLKLYPKDKITKIYAVEPNKEHHQQLLANAKSAGLLEENKFEIVDAYVENLESAGIQKGSMDTICTLQVLCSVPKPDALIPELRSYLKKGGGKWIVFEHVRRPERSGFLVLWQRALNIVWPHIFNGCNLTRRTQDWIERSGGWKQNIATGEGKLGPFSTASPYDIIPSIGGVLISE